ncbi:MAG: hypothetical protein IPP13_21785 [Kouleothrix sp.]|jgi:hypothetical protein|nr:hypothetical protein [Kouleothrix sp.]
MRSTPTKLIIALTLALLAFVLLACAGDATCSPQNDGSRAAAACITH